MFCSDSTYCMLDASSQYQLDPRGLNRKRQKPSYFCATCGWTFRKTVLEDSWGLSWGLLSSWIEGFCGGPRMRGQGRGLVHLYLWLSYLRRAFAGCCSIVKRKAIRQIIFPLLQLVPTPNWMFGRRFCLLTIICTVCTRAVHLMACIRFLEDKQVRPF